MDTIKNLLSRRIQQSGFANQVGTALLIEEAEKILKEKLGDVVVKKIKLLYFKNNILNIACLSSVVAQEINLKKQELITEINRKIGRDLVKEIRLVI